MITIEGGFIKEATKMEAKKNVMPFGNNFPDTIIIHYTAGSSAKSSADWLQRPDVKASAHIVVGKQGEIFQLVSFDKISWHAGESAYGGRTGFNKFSIGIELDNPGFLVQVGNEFIASFGTKYPANEVIQAVHRNETAPRFWHIYTEAQILACEEICLALISKYPSISQILGHEEIAPGRKQDPGPAFPLDKFRNKILHSNRQDDVDEVNPLFTKGKVITDKLNIREGAGVEFQKVALPLALNKELQVMGERNGWYHVKIEVDGWVNKAYVTEAK
jgi:N-acetylmuramoyl-L-alanine amidase